MDPIAAGAHKAPPVTYGHSSSLIPAGCPAPVCRFSDACLRPRDRAGPDPVATIAETLWSLRVPAERAGTTRDPVVDFVGAPSNRPLAKLERQRERPGPHLAINARFAQSGEPLDITAAKDLDFHLHHPLQSRNRTGPNPAATIGKLLEEHVIPPKVAAEASNLKSSFSRETIRRQSLGSVEGPDS